MLPSLKSKNCSADFKFGGEHICCYTKGKEVAQWFSNLILDSLENFSADSIGISTRFRFHCGDNVYYLVLGYTVKPERGGGAVNPLTPK